MKTILTAVIFVVTITIACVAGENRTQADAPSDINNSGSLTNGLFGLNDTLNKKGLDLKLSATGIYQQNTKGGLSTKNKKGRFCGSYDLELSGDMEKLFGIDHGSFYMLAEGSASNGINDNSVGSFFGVNGDAQGDHLFVIDELWYQQVLDSDRWIFRIGKIDLTSGFEHHSCPVAFDCSMFANDETSQFLNNALINNPTIPFPQQGLGISNLYAISEQWYVSAAVADAQAKRTSSGFDTAFDGKDYYFYILETGITPQLQSANGPLQGIYRIGTWYDPRPKANSDYAAEDKYYRDDTGFYLTFDQMFFKENPTLNDSQGLGTFFRYGYADGKKDDVTNFWSTGLQYQGIFDDRPDDVAAIGFAQGFFTDQAPVTFTEDYESVIEAYYNIAVTKWANLTPSIQYITNPAGDNNIENATIISLRLQMTF